MIFTKPVKRTIKFILTISFFFIFQSLCAQSSVNETIKAQAEKLSTSVFEGDYEALAKYTHPNIIKAMGGKEAMIRVIKTSMVDFENGNATFDKIEIGDDIIAKRYKKEYHALVPKTITITAKGQQVSAKSYLFGFSNEEGKAWTFIEADKLKSAAGKKLFPNFETDIVIPPKEAPVTVEDESYITFDDDEVTFEDDIANNSGFVIGYVLGFLFFFVFLIALAIGVFFLVRHLTRTKVARAPAAPTKPAFKKTEKITCGECETENNSDSKYCKLCGYALKKSN